MEREVLKMLGPCVDMTKAQTTHDTDKNLFMYQVGTTLPPPHLTHDTGGYRRFTHPASLIHALLLLPATAYHSGVPTGGLPSLLAPRHPDITLLYLSS